MRTALVAGATGAVAKRLIEALLQGGWRVAGLCRHPPESAVAVDFLDVQSCVRAIRGLQDVTHVFYCARAPFGEGGAEDVEQNVSMLRNLLHALEEAAPQLEHFHLVEGQKWYDVRRRHSRTPTREDDPRQPGPNFYYDQEDLLRSRQQGKRWSWSASRPQLLYDFAPERSRNLVSTIGVWAALCAGRGAPLDFPGTHASYEALVELTDATLLGRAMLWMATTPAAQNQAYNVTDGCPFRWKWLWPRIAAHFGLSTGEVRPLKLADSMTPHALASWVFADFFFGFESDNIASTVKIREHGFDGVVDTESQVLRYLRQYREARLLP